MRRCRSHQRHAGAGVVRRGLLLGLEHGGVQIEKVGELETKDATRWRLKWYAVLSVFSQLGVARVKGILP
jgi:hypothetical protein